MYPYEVATFLKKNYTREYEFDIKFKRNIINKEASKQ